MRRLIRGTDRGHALLISMVLILMISAIYITVAPQISAARKLAGQTRSRILSEIEQSNREALYNYDFY